MTPDTPVQAPASDLVSRITAALGVHFAPEVPPDRRLDLAREWSALPAFAQASSEEHVVQAIARKLLYGEPPFVLDGVKRLERTDDRLHWRKPVDPALRYLGTRTRATF